MLSSTLRRTSVCSVEQRMTPESADYERDCVKVQSDNGYVDDDGGDRSVWHFCRMHQRKCLIFIQALLPSVIRTVEFRLNAFWWRKWQKFLIFMNQFSVRFYGKLNGKRCCLHLYPPQRLRNAQNSHWPRSTTHRNNKLNSHTPLYTTTTFHVENVFDSRSTSEWK